jgi:hypothetical protein
MTGQLQPDDAPIWDEQQAKKQLTLHEHAALLWGIPGYCVFIQPPQAEPYRSRFEDGVFAERTAERAERAERAVTALAAALAQATKEQSD